MNAPRNDDRSVESSLSQLSKKTVAAQSDVDEALHVPDFYHLGKLDRHVDKSAVDDVIRREAQVAEDQNRRTVGIKTSGVGTDARLDYYERSDLSGG